MYINLRVNKVVSDASTTGSRHKCCELKQRLLHVGHGIDQTDIDNVIDDCRARLCYTRAAFQLFSLSSMGLDRDLFLAPYWLSGIRQKLAELLLSTGSSSTSMPTTAKFTSPRQ